MSNKGRHAWWVKQYVGTGQWAKRVDSQYHLYEMEAGKTVLVGIITEEGLIETAAHIEKMTCTIYEYGASKALILLCPSRWKISIGTQWERYLFYIIYEISPTSYLFLRNTPECLQGMHLARKKLDLFMAQEYGVSIRDVFGLLSGIRLLINEQTGEQRLSEPSQEQLAFASGLHIDLEVQ